MNIIIWKYIVIVQLNWNYYIGCDVFTKNKTHTLTTSSNAIISDKSMLYSWFSKDCMCNITLCNSKLSIRRSDKLNIELAASDRFNNNIFSDSIVIARWQWVETAASLNHYFISTCTFTSINHKQNIF